MNIQNKTFIVTGGGTGLGLGIAERMATESANVVITSRNLDNLKQTAEELNEKVDGKVIAFACDIRDKSQVDALIENVLQQFGSIDYLVNNSGLAIPDKVIDCKLEDWNTVIETNLTGTFLMSQAVLPTMVKQGSGFILNIASQAAKRGYSDVASYCASKYAVVGFAEALQQEVKSSGIRVHSICPGLIQVPTPGESNDINSEILQIQDVVETVAFILSRPKHVKLENIGLFNLFDKDV